MLVHSVSLYKLAVPGIDVEEANDADRPDFGIRDINRVLDSVFSHH